MRVVASNDVSSWDNMVWGQARGNIFSAAGWGTYKARCGAAIDRLTVVDEANDVLAIAQVQIYRRGPTRQIYIQGGPLLTDKGERQGGGAIRCLLAHLALRTFDLVFVDFIRAESAGATLGLLSLGFKPVVSAGRYTLEVDTRRGLDTIAADMEPRWRKALRKAERNAALTVRFLDDPAERLAAFDAFTTMYAALKVRKGFSNNFKAEAYRDIVAHDPHHLMLEAREEDERVLVRIAHLSQSRCTDFLTAATDRAKVNGAASLAVWSLVRRAVAEGCEIFDFGGIDPLHNQGVFDFKRGLTRNVASSGPLWIFGKTRLVTAAAGVLLAR